MTSNINRPGNTTLLIGFYDMWSCILCTRIIAKTSIKRRIVVQHQMAMRLSMRKSVKRREDLLSSSVIQFRGVSLAFLLDFQRDLMNAKLAGE